MTPNAIEAAGNLPNTAPSQDLLPWSGRGLAASIVQGIVFIIDPARFVFSIVAPSANEVYIKRLYQALCRWINNSAMSSLTITPIPAFTDNYLWLLERGGKAAIVDPGDAAPVERALQERRLELSAILVTHWHPDHIGGLSQLRSRHEVPVYGPAAESARIPGLTHPLREGDRVRLEPLGLELEVWEVPGHTSGHIAYISFERGADAPRTKNGFILCGDTLFSAGCGRLFEGTPEQMQRSLSRLAALPADTAVYCTHEYTLANLAFAAAVEPGNADISAEIERVRGLRARDAPSLPSRIGRELRINPFLRTGEAAVIEAARRHAGRRPASPIETFAALRRWKDGFRAPRAP